MNRATLYTTLGPKHAGELGMILPHEHLFVDLGPIEAASYLHANIAEAVALMAPEAASARAAANRAMRVLIGKTSIFPGRLSAAPTSSLGTGLAIMAQDAWSSRAPRVRSVI